MHAARPQLSGHMVALGVPIKSCGDDTMPLRRALTAGLFPHAAKRQLDGERAAAAAAAAYPSTSAGSSKGREHLSR